MDGNSSAYNLKKFLDKFAWDFEPTRRSEFNSGYQSGVIESLFGHGHKMHDGWDIVSKYIAEIYYLTNVELRWIRDELDNLASSTIYNEESAREALTRTEAKVDSILNDLNIK